MSVLINADTSDGLKFTSDTSGEIKLQSGGTDIATVSSSGITMASGKNLVTTAPAFSAYDASLISLSNATWTKITYTTEDYDTNSNFASSTFTPTVAGYYQINTGLFVPGGSSSGATMALYKNGSLLYQLNRVSFSASFNHFLNGSAIVNMNGSTDYLEIYVTQSSGTTLSFGNNLKDGRWFNGCLVRAS